MDARVHSRDNRRVVQAVTSRDGTRIAYFRSGHGPPLVLVHGATADHTTSWRSVLPLLERHFTVLAMDRRGRGASGDTEPYELAREAEDVAAVVDAAGEPVSVFGHSHGALCALEAALLTPNLRHMILYEGVPFRGDGDFAPGVIERLEATLAAGDIEGVLVGLLRDIVEMPTGEIELMRSQRDAWSVRLGNVCTTPRELRAYERYAFDSTRFSTLRTKTLFLVGGSSPVREHEHAASIAALLPDASVLSLAGQAHIANYTAPDDLAREVIRFCDS